MVAAFEQERRSEQTTSMTMAKSTEATILEKYWRTRDYRRRSVSSMQRWGDAASDTAC